MKGDVCGYISACFSDNLRKEGNHDFSHAGHDFEKELTYTYFISSAG